MAAATPPIGATMQQVREPTGGGTIPFRRATTGRSTQLISTVQGALSTAQNVEVTIEGSGYMYALDLSFFATTAGNAAATAFTEDGPWAAAASVVLRDVNGELVN